MTDGATAETAVRVRVPLTVKLGVLITALVVLSVVLVGAFLLDQQQRSLTAEMTKRGLTIAQNFAASAKTPILTGDELTLAVLVKDAMKDPDVAYVVVSDAQGQPLAESDPSPLHGPIRRPETLRPAQDGVLVQAYEAIGLRIIDFAVPLTYSQIPVGALYLGFSQGAIDSARAHARNRTLLITLGMVGLGMAGAAALATVLSRPIFRLVEGTRAIAAGDLDVRLRVGSHDEVGVLTDSFNRMARHLKEKEMIKRAFSRYVAREVVDEILKDPEHLILSGERREVTVLFCDMRGFTPLSERLSPEEVVLLLNDFYTLMIETTFKHDGTLDKFMGDAVMAIFGAPIRHADHSERAVRTALAMREGMVDLNERRRREGKEPIEIGIGVSAGEAVAGTVGTEDRMEYTVVGDSVNLGARLGANAGPAQILISQRTWEHVTDAVDARHLGPLRVKGKEEQVEVYEVLGLRGPEGAR